MVVVGSRQISDKASIQCYCTSGHSCHKLYRSNAIFIVSLVCTASLCKNSVGIVDASDHRLLYFFLEVLLLFRCILATNLYVKLAWDD